ncbi:MAG TPA: oligosaccharide flippase family protein, partial [Candidatus Nanoarchaeia archaeon]|nr:oligosaccharide flippase family protein [Candidatus Nanoarchaeia archaeon]
MSYLHMALKGTSWLLVFHVLSSIAAYVTRIFLARSLRPEEYGLFYAVFSVVTFFLFFRDLGIAPSLSRYIPEFKIQQKFNEIKTAIVTVVLFQIIGSLVGVIILFFLADYLAAVYFKDPNASIMLKILLFYVFFSLFFRITRAIFHGFQSMFLFATGEFARAAVTLILMVLFVWLGYGILSPALAYALLNPILMLVYMPFLIKEFNFFKHKIVNFKEITKKIVIYSIPLFVTQIASKFISDVDTFILTLFRTTKEIGIYHVVLPTSQLLLFFGTSVSLALFPISAELF